MSGSNMNTGHSPALDREVLEGLHSKFFDRANDLAIELQDRSYEVGVARGRADGQAARDKLLGGLREAVLALAHASQKDALYRDAYRAVKKLIEEATGSEEPEAKPAVYVPVGATVRALLMLERRAALRLGLTDDAPLFAMLTPPSPGGAR